MIKDNYTPNEIHQLLTKYVQLGLVEQKKDSFRLSFLYKINLRKAGMLFLREKDGDMKAIIKAFAVTIHPRMFTEQELEEVYLVTLVFLDAELEKRKKQS